MQGGEIRVIRKTYLSSLYASSLNASCVLTPFILHKNPEILGLLLSQAYKGGSGE